MMTVQVKGLAELSRDMRALGPKISLRALRSALGAGAKVVKQDIVARVPVKTGRLQRAVYVKRMNKPNPFMERFIVGIRSGKAMQKRDLDAWYWKFFEFGTKERFHKNGKSVGSIAKRSFVVPAFETKKEQALARIKEVLTRKIAQIVREK